MSENDKQETKSVEEKEVKKEATETTVEAASTSKSSKKSLIKLYTVAVLSVLIVFMGVLYKLEKEGRSSTNVFESLIEYQEANKVVAVVNGQDITNAELQTSIDQFGQAATAQGVDLTNPAAAAEIRSQSLEVLVNTELLRQTALAEGIEVTEEDVEARITGITEQLGGEEALSARMEVLGLTPEKLETDVMTELVIQEYLDKIFAEVEIEITEEEITAVYESAGGEDAGLPALDEIEEQVRLQIKTSKEQEILDTKLKELKEEADIEII